MPGLIKRFNAIGYDLSRGRVNQPNSGFDINNEFKKTNFLIQKN